MKRPSDVDDHVSRRSIDEEAPTIPGAAGRVQLGLPRGLLPGGRFRTPIGVTISGVKRLPVLAGLLAITWVGFIAAQTGGAPAPAPKPAARPAATPAAKPPAQAVATAEPAAATAGS